MWEEKAPAREGRPLLLVGGREGAIEEMGGGVGRPSAVWALGILGCPDPLR